MKTIQSSFGKFTHTILCPDTPEDEAMLRRCEKSLLHITVDEIDTMKPGQEFSFLPHSMDHERDSHVLHLYRY